MTQERSCYLCSYHFMTWPSDGHGSCFSQLKYPFIHQQQQHQKHVSNTSRLSLHERILFWSRVVYSINQIVLTKRLVASLLHNICAIKKKKMFCKCEPPVYTNSTWMEVCCIKAQCYDVLVFLPLMHQVCTRLSIGIVPAIFLILFYSPSISKFSPLTCSQGEGLPLPKNHSLSHLFYSALHKPCGAVMLSY